MHERSRTACAPQPLSVLRLLLLLLPQVLTGLAQAQKLGFRHWDLRLKNIMEHHPSQQSAQPAEDSRKAIRLASTSVAADSQGQGHKLATTAMRTAAEYEADSWVNNGGAHHAASSGPAAQLHAIGKHGGAAAARLANSCDGSQRRNDNQGPELGECCRWQIIDYGHADIGDRTLRDDAVCLDGPISNAEQAG